MTLLHLPENTLKKKAEQSITSEVRGWLSLAAMTKRFEDNPMKQLNALKTWRQTWPSHPATRTPPSSLQILSRIVEQRPTKIALILPLTGELGTIGRAIRDGYISAHYEFAPESNLKIYDSSGADIQTSISRAVRENAQIIIGPLDRTKVTEAAKLKLKIPVIALNRTLNNEVNPNLYQFGLSPEDESRQVAAKILSEGKKRGLIIAPENDWGSRNVDAFTETFLQKGGTIVDVSRFTNQRDYSELIKSLLNVDSSESRARELRRITGARFEFTPRRRQDIDFVFLLSNATQAKGLNPTISFFYADDIPVYATSHVHNHTDSKIDAFDMAGITFCEMPWKLSSSDNIRKVIHKIWGSEAKKLSAFYALGVDAHRVYSRLPQLKEFPATKIHGGTGVLNLNKNNVVNRTLTWVRFKNGNVTVVPEAFDIP